MNNAVQRHAGVGARLLLAAALAVLAALPAPATAASASGPGYPSKPVKIISGFPPGGSADLVARLIAERLGSRYGQSFVVENRAGAGGTIGAGVVARAPADGYTLLLGVTASQTIAPAIYPDLSYDAAKDFAPVTMLATIPVALVVNPDVPAQDAKSFVALAGQARPPLAYASSGVGAMPHLTAEIFQRAQNVTMMHVPFKGAAPAMTDLLAGRVQLIFDHLPSVLPSIRAGKLRVLGIAGEQRATALPEVPTLAEQGLQGVAVRSWLGLLAPAGTPAAIVQQLNRDVNALLAEDGVRKALGAMGAEPSGSTADQFAEIIASDTRQWSEVVRATGARNH
ncbi:tripartite tricarboxylate transporter substrate binding protein [Bordetella genomosp. 13]|uniref:tripartite tricarboxylate transporter substrate binding protein n=1 Tax=Bordetella genomosp. 13 TaxID=463040 RepID=UPI0011A7A2EF|nr:tripartite tricarboxylate transporter substrate binding protein [Bordetella genomosp. 13]